MKVEKLVGIARNEMNVAAEEGVKAEIKRRLCVIKDKERTIKRMEAELEKLKQDLEALKEKSVAEAYEEIEGKYFIDSVSDVYFTLGNWNFNA